MAADIAPALLEQVRREFEKRTVNYGMFQRLANKIRDGTATQRDAQLYAQQLGAQLSIALKSVLTKDALPDGKLYWNIANRVITPMLENNYRLANETAAQIRRWEEKFGRRIPVSVNLSRADVFDPTLVDRLLALMRENGLDYRSFKLEVTESAYTDNAKHVLDVIRHLRSLGFEIEMDDFGSGYSSLNMLSDMPIDVLKMDMKFVRQIEESETDLRLVKLILDIAKYLRLTVVAEGVETEGQLQLLKDAGCDLIQGYYFSRPLPPEDFEDLIRKEQAIVRD